MTLPLQRKDGTPIEWWPANGFSRYLISTDGQVYSLKADRIMKENLNSSGYVRVAIYNDDNEYKQVLVHRLVYLAHVGDIPDGLQINHKDENKMNNHIENLELLTPKQNIHYGTCNTRRRKSVRNYWKQRQAMCC